jgi:hypothetical protein
MQKADTSQPGKRKLDVSTQISLFVWVRLKEKPFLVRGLHKKSGVSVLYSAHKRLA